MVIGDAQYILETSRKATKQQRLSVSIRGSMNKNISLTILFYCLKHLFFIFIQNKLELFILIFITFGLKNCFFSDR